MNKKSLFLFLLFFAWSIFAQDPRFGHTTLQFFFNEISTGYLSTSLLVWTWDSWFWMDVSNPSSDDYSLHLDFVSQISSNDGLHNKTCDMVSWFSFWSYLSRNTWIFIVPSQSTVRKRVNFNFPACASWLYAGCVIQTSPSVSSLSDFDLVVGKVNFIDLYVQPSASCAPFSLKIFPWSRPGRNFSNRGELKFYNQNNQLILSGSLETNTDWTWIFQQFLPSWIYYAVYKGQSQLASYLSGVQIINWEEFVLDFTTGTNLYNVQNRSISEDDGYRYQIAGDLKNSIGNYDFTINGNDIAILTASGFIDNGISVLDPKNLNGDWAINVSDISVIGINFELTDPFFIWSNLFSR